MWRREEPKGKKTVTGGGNHPGCLVLRGGGNRNENLLLKRVKSRRRKREKKGGEWEPTSFFGRERGTTLSIRGRVESFTILGFQQGGGCSSEKGGVKIEIYQAFGQASNRGFKKTGGGKEWAQDSGSQIDS